MTCYRVSGTQRVAGHEPGDVFEASYSGAHELYLLQGGHLELVQAEPSDDGDVDSAGDTGDTQRRGRTSANSREEQD